MSTDNNEKLSDEKKAAMRPQSTRVVQTFDPKKHVYRVQVANDKAKKIVKNNPESVAQATPEQFYQPNPLVTKNTGLSPQESGAQQNKNFRNYKVKPVPKKFEASSAPASEEVNPSSSDLISGNKDVIVEKNEDTARHKIPPHTIKNETKEDVIEPAVAPPAPPESHNQLQAKILENQESREKKKAEEQNIAEIEEVKEKEDNDDDLSEGNDLSFAALIHKNLYEAGDAKPNKLNMQKNQDGSYKMDFYARDFNGPIKHNIYVKGEITVDKSGNKATLKPADPTSAAALVKAAHEKGFTSIKITAGNPEVRKAMEQQAKELGIKVDNGTAPKVAMRA